MIQAKYLQDIQSLQRRVESEMNVTKDELIVCNALIFDLQEHIKVLEGGVYTSKTELESLILESEW